jgi:transcriptional regulator with XRE-family HTH domain
MTRTPGVPPYLGGGNALRRARDRSGLSQAALARRAGIDPRRVSRYERSTPLALRDFAALARVLEVRIGDLVES